MNDGARFAEMQEAIRARDTARIKELWNALLPELDEQTFYGFIAGSDSFKEAGFAPPRGVRTGGLRHRRLGHRLPQLHPRNPPGRLHRRRRPAPAHRRRRAAAPRGAVGARAVGHGPLARRHFPGIPARGCPAGRRGRASPATAAETSGSANAGDANPPTRAVVVHLPVLAAVDADRHRRNAVSRRAVDGDRTLALHAVLQDLRHGGPAVLEGHATRRRAATSCP